MSSVRAARRACGSVSMAEARRSSAAAGRDWGDGAARGEAMVQRWFARVASWVEMVEAIMSMLSRKVVTSPERMSRSDASGMWPERSADTRSMQAWRSSGSVGAREGRVVNVLMSICVLRRVERAVVRVWILVSELSNKFW